MQHVAFHKFIFEYVGLERIFQCIGGTGRIPYDHPTYPTRDRWDSGHIGLR